MELAILAWLAAHRAAWLDPIMVALTWIGRAGAVWIVVAVVRGALRRPLAMAACQVVLAMMVAWIVSDAVLKPLVHRARPFVASASLQTATRERPSDSSFPSGHATTAGAGAAALAAMWPGARVAWWTLAVLIALSRAYLGVHYPTDLAAGLLLGWLIARFVVGGTRWRAVQRTAPRPALQR